MLLKYALAALLAVGLVWLGSFLRPDLPGDLGMYLVAVALALLCFRMTGQVGSHNWIAAAVILVIGVIFLWLGQLWAVYVIAAGFGVVAGTLAALAFGQGHGSPARA